tara:strand:+ start:1117 stop:1428 length:312 start_codon:yes stop_codon:yes gene_type:complete
MNRDILPLVDNDVLTIIGKEVIKIRDKKTLEYWMEINSQSSIKIFRMFLEWKIINNFIISNKSALEWNNHRKVLGSKFKSQTTNYTPKRAVMMESYWSSDDDY